MNYDDNVENVECICGETTTREHSWSPIKGLENGELYQECLNEGCTASKRWHTCIKGSAEKIFFENDDENCYTRVVKCTICQKVLEEKVIKHYKVGDYNAEVCMNYGCHWQRPHKFVVESFDDDNENLKCTDCDYTRTREHSWGEIVNLETGELHQECQNDGCSASKTWHTCIKDSGEKIFFENDDENCYKRVYKCTICQKILEEKVVKHQKTNTKDKEICLNCSWNRPHDFVVESFDDSIENLKCTDCDYKTTREHNYVIKSCDNYLENLECECGATTTRRHVFGESYQDEDGKYVQKCENEGCNYIRTEHLCNTDGGISDTEFVGTDDICYKYNVECGICHKKTTIEVGHDFFEIPGQMKMCMTPGCGWSKDLTQSKTSDEEENK